MEVLVPILPLLYREVCEPLGAEVDPHRLRRGHDGIHPELEFPTINEEGLVDVSLHHPPLGLWEIREPGGDVQPLRICTLRGLGDPHRKSARCIELGVVVLESSGPRRHQERPREVDRGVLPQALCQMIHRGRLLPLVAHGQPRPPVQVVVPRQLLVRPLSLAPAHRGARRAEGALRLREVAAALGCPALHPQGQGARMERRLGGVGVAHPHG
mmetsp:Transcript_10299/g.33238  ORF Transcript_10299/g.33238 Transcript_10299/m.33238 type:complete len:213 (+) Transcript_10299:807-1445(+)